jgi:hypothetical protein
MHRDARAVAARKRDGCGLFSSWLKTVFFEAMLESASRKKIYIVLNMASYGFNASTSNKIWDKVPY